MDPPFFFVHPMKTGGVTLRRQALLNFTHDQLFPDPRGLDRFAAVVVYQSVGPFLTIEPETRRRIRFYSGHVPFAVAETAVPEAVTITLVRDPVARIVSYLRHCQRDHQEHRGCSLEEIYEDPWYSPRLIENYQTKLFSMSAAEAMQPQDDPVFQHLDHRTQSFTAAELEALRRDPEFVAEMQRQLQLAGNDARTSMRFADRAPTERVQVDDGRLATAVTNLDRVDVLGVTEHLDDLLGVLAQDHKWTIGPPERANASQDREPVSETFRARIARDNVYDQALYEHARRHRHRRSG